MFNVCDAENIDLSSFLQKVPVVSLKPFWVSFELIKFYAKSLGLV